MYWKGFRKTCFVGATALLISACASDAVRQRDGVNYGVTSGTFRARWWNYYERGVSYLDGEFYAEAAADFEKAMALRPSDAWRARTYGLHFVSYFPNRELGVCYAKLGKHAEAIAQLEAALAQVDTARGHAFLASAQRAQLAAGTLVDGGAPALQLLPGGALPIALMAPAAQDRVAAQATVPMYRLLGPPNGPMLGMVSAMLFGALPEGASTAATGPEPATFVTSKQALPVAIQAADDLAVQDLQLNGAPVYTRSEGKQVKAAANVPLYEGVNELVARARDLAGNETETRVQIVLDLNAPVIAVLDPPPAFATAKTTVDIRGSVQDDVALAEVEFNGQKLLSMDGVDAAEAPPRDLEVNETEVALTTGALNELPLRAVDTAGNETSYVVDVQQGNTPINSSRADTPWPGEIVLAAVQSVAPVSEGIQLDFPDGVSVYADELELGGAAASDEGIVELGVGGAMQTVAATPLARWSRRVTLAPGSNTVSVVAKTSKGRSLNAALTLQRVAGYLDSEAARLKVVLAGPGLGAEDVAAQFGAAMRADGRFMVTKEEGLEASKGDGGRAQAIAVASKAGAQVLFYHEFFRRGTALELLLYVVDVESGETFTFLDAQVPDATNGDAVTFRLQGLLEELKRAIPKTQGTLLDESTVGLVLPKGTWMVVGGAPGPNRDFQPHALAQVSASTEKTSTIRIVKSLGEADAGIPQIAVAL